MRRSALEALVRIHSPVQIPDFKPDDKIAAIFSDPRKPPKCIQFLFVSVIFKHGHDTLDNGSNFLSVSHLQDYFQSNGSWLKFCFSASPAEMKLWTPGSANIASSLRRTMESPCSGIYDKSEKGALKSFTEKKVYQKKTRWRAGQKRNIACVAKISVTFNQTN